MKNDVTMNDYLQYLVDSEAYKMWKGFATDITYHDWLQDFRNYDEWLAT